MHHLAAALLLNPNAQAHVRARGDRGCKDARAMNSDFYLWAGCDSAERQEEKESPAPPCSLGLQAERTWAAGQDGAGAPQGWLRAVGFAAR